MRTVLALIACCAAAAASLTGCGSQAPADGVPTPSEADAALADAPPPLAALHAQASELLPSADGAFDRRMAELRGHPVVVNVWATWCGPCKQEFPVFQRAAVRYGNTVAFLGVNARDVERDARQWLRDNWVAYPSYVDPGEETARQVGATVGLPTTAFFDRDGKRAYLHQGPYREDADLDRDLQRYLGATP